MVVRVVHGTINPKIAGADDEKGQNVQDQNRQDVDLRCDGLGVHWETDADLLVTAHPNQWKHGEDEAEDPSAEHHGRRVVQMKLAIQPHGKGDGVPPLQGDHRKGVHRELAGEDGEKPRQPAPGARLPVYGVIEVLGPSVEVYRSNEQQVDPHAQVCDGQVTHEETGHWQLVVAGEQHQQDHHVSQNSQQAHEPHRHSQEAKAHYVLARVKLVGCRCALHLLSFLTHHIIITAVKVLARVLLGVLQGLSKAHILVWLAPKVSVVVQAAMEITDPPVLLGLSLPSIIQILFWDCFHHAVTLEGRHAQRRHGALVMLIVECGEVTDDVLQKAGKHTRTRYYACEN